MCLRDRGYRQIGTAALEGRKVLGQGSLTYHLSVSSPPLRSLTGLNVVDGRTRSARWRGGAVASHGLLGMTVTGRDARDELLSVASCDREKPAWGRRMQTLYVNPMESDPRPGGPDCLRHGQRASRSTCRSIITQRCWSVSRYRGR